MWPAPNWFVAESTVLPRVVGGCYWWSGVGVGGKVRLTVCSVWRVVERNGKNDGSKTENFLLNSSFETSYSLSVLPGLQVYSPNCGTASRFYPTITWSTAEMNSTAS
jgi:hypothetical protein